MGNSLWDCFILLTAITTYFSNDLKIDKIFDNNDKLFDLNKKEYTIEDNSDLVIKGIGFINIKKACKLIIYTEYDKLIEIRKSMF